jgi:hypothetical protein
MEIMYKILAFKNAVIKFAVTCKFETVQIDILRACLIITELETISFLDFTHVSRFSDTFFSFRIVTWRYKDTTIISESLVLINKRLNTLRKNIFWTGIFENYVAY